MSVEVEISFSCVVAGSIMYHLRNHVAMKRVPTSFVCTSSFKLQGSESSAKDTVFRSAIPTPRTYMLNWRDLLYYYSTTSSTS